MIKSGYAYHASAGESFDSIALEVYGDEKYAAELMCLNPFLCERIVFEGGEEVELAVIDTDTKATADEISETAPWK